MKDFKKFSSSLFKKAIRKLFILYNGKIKVANLKSNNLPKGVIKNNKNGYFLYRIKCGKVFTDNVQNVAIIKDNFLISNSSYQQHLGYYLNAKKNFVVRYGTPKFLKKISGNTLSLVQGASGENYFHWLFDVMPKLKITFDQIKQKKIDYYYLPEIKSNFQKEILSKLNISKKKIINSNKIRYLQSDELLVPEHPWFTKGYMFKEYNKLPSWIIKWLRKKFLKKTNIKSKYKYIYIDRSDSAFNRSQILNSNLLWKELKNYGFKRLILSNKKFSDQVKIFQNCKIVIGATGAGLANLAFCKKSTKVIELRPKKYKSANVYQRISKVNKLRYSKIIIDNDKKTNFTVPVPKIIELLNK